MVALILLAASALASPNRVTMEDGVHTVPSQSWEQLDRCGATDPISLHLVLTISSPSLKRLEDTFWAVSDPTHPRYGQHLSVSEIAEIVGSTSVAISNVTRWLNAHGATHTSVSSTRDIVKVTLPCGEAERAFQTTIHRFRHMRTKTELLRATVAHSLPTDIALLVALVGDLSGLPDPRGPIVVPKEQTVSVRYHTPLSTVACTKMHTSE